MSNDLKDTLDLYAASTLNAIASYHSLKVGSNKKMEVIRHLTVYFSHNETIEKTFAALAPAPREVIYLLLRAGGEASITVIRQRLLAKNLIQPDKEKPIRYPPVQPEYRQESSPQLPEIMAHLLACGLAFGRNYRNQYGQESVMDFNLAQRYFIPEVIRRALPPPPPEPEWQPVLLGDAPARISESSARSFQRDLYLYWSYLDQTPGELTAKNLLMKRHLTAINNTLLVKETIQTGQGENDFGRLVFLRALLEQMGLVIVKDFHVNTAPAADFFALEPQERVKRSLEAYIGCTQLNELAQMHRIDTTYDSTPLLPTPAVILDARRLIVLHLKPAQKWMNIKQVVERIRSMHYEFLFPRDYYGPENGYYHPSHPYSVSTNSLLWQFPDISADAAGWEQVEGGLIRGVIQGALYWMGLVDLGYSTPNGSQPDSFRLTSLGAWLVGNGPAPEIASTGGQVVVQPDFTITVFDPVSDAVLHQLEQFAQRITAERAVVLRLTQKSVYAAQQRNWNAARIQSHLEGLTGQPLPANVARTLQEWQAQHERIHIFPHVVIVHAAKAEDLQTLSQDKELSAWLGDQPVAGLAVLPDKKRPEDFVLALMKRQWMPLVTHQVGTVTGNSVEIDDEGHLTFRVTTPDLNLRGFLARFADPEGQQAYHLTPASVRRAANSGIPAPQIITELQKVAHGAVPAKLRKRILAWAGHYGSARLEETVLISFKDGQTVAELLKDEDFASLLHVIRPADVAAMVKVNSKDVEIVRRLFEERGIEIKHHGHTDTAD